MPSSIDSGSRRDLDLPSTGTAISLLPQARICINSWLLLSTTSIWRCVCLCKPSMCNARVFGARAREAITSAHVTASGWRWIFSSRSSQRTRAREAAPAPLVSDQQPTWLLRAINKVRIASARPSDILHKTPGLFKESFLRFYGKPLTFSAN